MKQWQEEAVQVSIIGAVWFLWIILVIGGILVIHWVKSSWRVRL